MEAVSRQGDTSRRDELTSRIAAYLRCLGLPASHADAQARAVLELPAARSGVGHEEIVLALADVRSRFEAWLDYLCKTAGEGRGARCGLLAWHMRPVLAANPELFLRQGDLEGDLPAPLRLAVEASAQPAVPEETPAPMPAQPLGELPRFFRGSFWRDVLEQLGSGSRSLGRWIRGR